MNGRGRTNDFTSVSLKASVIDYCIVHHDDLQKICNFRVTQAREVFDKTGCVGDIDTGHSILDHSLLSWSLSLPGPVDIDTGPLQSVNCQEEFIK